MKSKKAKLLLWSPRILALIFAVVLLYFSRNDIVPGTNFKTFVVDLFGRNISNIPYKEIATNFFMKNIPALIMIAIVVVSWTYEITGGLAFILVGISHMAKSVIDHKQLNMEWYTALALSLLIAVPAFVIGYLYLMNWFIRPKTLDADNDSDEPEEEENEETVEEATR
ncbi:MAG: hypothetical protein GXZ02_01485 [Clostridiales bacterium]|nr:hypothetical protein [Clostridiales bacterium]